MPNVWRVKLMSTVDLVPKWDVFCGTELHGTEFESLDEAEVFLREHLPDGWTSEWPLAAGWYWFWDPQFPDLVEPAKMMLLGSGGGYPMYSRSSEEIREDRYPGCWWCLMEKPPPAPDPDAEDPDD